MDSTLVDFTDMKWQRGDLTFIFNGDVKGMCIASTWEGCCWMGSHFYDWTGYNGVALSGTFNEVARGHTLSRVLG